MTRQLREYKLSDPVREYFENRDYKVYTEIPIAGSQIDIIAIKNDFIIAVELKTSLTRQLIHQCIRHQKDCDIIYTAVPVNPSSENIRLCKKCSIGIIKVLDKVEIVLEAKQHNLTSEFKHTRMLNFCDTIIVNKGVGGLPTIKGKGPRIECIKRVKEYLFNNPCADWKELFKNVHNHYYNYKSMQSALREKI